MPSFAAKPFATRRMLLAVIVAAIMVMAVVVFDPAWRVDARHRAVVDGHCVPSLYNDGTCTAPARLDNGRRVRAILPLRAQGYATGEAVAIERHRSLIFGRYSYHIDNSRAEDGRADDGSADEGAADSAPPP
jgi:hypothetical protein